MTPEEIQEWLRWAEANDPTYANCMAAARYGGLTRLQALEAACAFYAKQVKAMKESLLAHAERQPATVLLVRPEWAETAKALVNATCQHQWLIHHDPMGTVPERYWLTARCGKSGLLDEAKAKPDNCLECWGCKRLIEQGQRMATFSLGSRELKIIHDDEECRSLARGWANAYEAGRKLGEERAAKEVAWFLEIMKAADGSVPDGADQPVIVRPDP
jgi:hypothetical protein